MALVERQLNAAQEDYEWWSSLKHGGLLIAPSKLREHYPPTVPPLPLPTQLLLRREVNRFQDQVESVYALLDLVLEKVLGLSGTECRWYKGNQVPIECSKRLITGETKKPQRLFHGKHGAILPVFVEDTGVRLGLGRGRRAVSRVTEWLRRANLRLCLLTNGRQWRIVYAGPDYEAYAESDASLWFEQGGPGPQLAALRILLGPESVIPARDGEECRLLSAIEASRKGQAELSEVLGEQVRQAVEILIRESASNLEKLDGQVRPSDVYAAACRMVMRMVVVLFAEARDLLPRDNPLYHTFYGLTGLRETLELAAGGSYAERLSHRLSAWPRILSLFRLVHEGSPHEALPVTRFDGQLFEPGNPQSDDPISRAVAAFEDVECCPNDAVVYRILHLLCRSSARVRQGTGYTRVSVPVDFSDLSSEYIGILYQALLDYELRRAPDADPVVFLNLGDQPALPLSKLGALDDRQIALLLDKFKVKTRLGAPEDDREEEDVNEEQSEGLGSDSEEEYVLDEEPSCVVGASGVEDVRGQAMLAARQWALRAVRSGGLVPKPKAKSTAAMADYEKRCIQAADRLVARVVLPREWYLVRWGGTRKGAGTFYTRPQLAVPTTRRTLQLLAYDPPVRDGRPDEDADLSEWIPKSPEIILGLKVCDPACGSGSFLISALRFLTEALMRSLYYHKRIRDTQANSLVTLAVGRAESGRLSDEVLPCRPDSEEFESRLRARLKRHVVERCIYGVDIDPLAVELARVSLWIETMDRTLPFTFLDHKIKVGNSLVGCWFDRFTDYPFLAWEREGGDRSHTNGVHFRKGEWTRAIREFKRRCVLPEMARADSTQIELPLLGGKAPDELLREARQALDSIHALPVGSVQEQSDAYRTLASAKEFKQLKQLFNLWCSIWFWPPERIDCAPRPSDFLSPGDITSIIVAEVSNSNKFFHWELEFPDVFTEEGSGFDAVLGNPPWDTIEPKSQEFFSNFDPLYRTYGKQQAVAAQSHMFRVDRQIEYDWLMYCLHVKSVTNWAKHTGHAIGRQGLRTSYSDRKHPFVYQGEGKCYTYKMFLEVSHAILRTGGRLGMIVPSNLYTDGGTVKLRDLFTQHCRWEWLFGFENREGIFADIHKSFKFCPIVVQKGSSTDSIRTAFMRKDVADWERGEQFTAEYRRAYMEQFSPTTRAILEVRDRRDLEVLSKMHGASLPLSDDSPRGWGLHYSQGKFNITTNSHLIAPVSWWREQGYRTDEYGRLVKGRWHACQKVDNRLAFEPGVVLSAEGSACINENDITDVALPLYQGVMLWQYDFAHKAHVLGSGLRTRWSLLGWPKNLQSLAQFAVDIGVSRKKDPAGESFTVSHRRVQNVTNERTMVATLLPGFPAGDTIARLSDYWGPMSLGLLCALNSFPLDMVVRLKVSQNHVDHHYVRDLPVPPRTLFPSALLLFAASLGSAHEVFAPIWLDMKNTLGRGVFRRSWALTSHERLRIRCIIDAVIAELYGLDLGELTWVLRQCDYPTEWLNSTGFARTLDPKGFWRVDKDVDPECRHTVLTLVAFHELKQAIARADGSRERGILDFLMQNHGEGWMLPVTLRLADYGLGHDDRAKHPQPVRERLGPRFFPWQLQQTPEESWKECELHARNLLGEAEFDRLKSRLSSRAEHQAERVFPAYSVEYGRPGVGRAAEERGRYETRDGESKQLKLPDP